MSKQTTKRARMRAERRAAKEKRMGQPGAQSKYAKKRGTPVVLPPTPPGRRELVEYLIRLHNAAVREDRITEIP